MQLDEDWIRSRQNRLVETLAEQGVEHALLTRAESIQWLTGAYVGPLFCPSAAIDAAGRVTLVLPNRKVGTPAVADEVLGYEEKKLSTMRDASEQRHASVDAVLATFPAKTQRIGYEATSAFCAIGERLGASPVDLDAALFRLRRRKDADELAIMARANEANRAMYELARSRIGPGLNELDLYNELHGVAVRTLGEPLTYFGQDFRCNARGGPPRDRSAEEGELWILDLGVGLR
ncbi:MAG: aminopeptidase P family N-terminal domain-containing protein, partial [Planctomycetota bacterium]